MRKAFIAVNHLPDFRDDDFSHGCRVEAMSTVEEIATGVVAKIFVAAVYGRVT